MLPETSLRDDASSQIGNVGPNNDAVPESSAMDSQLKERWPFQSDNSKLRSDEQSLPLSPDSLSSSSVITAD
jgi:hypothetical protein